MLKIRKSWGFVVKKLEKLRLKIVADLDRKNGLERFRRNNLAAVHDVIEKNLDISVKVPKLLKFDEPKWISVSTFQVCKKGFLNPNDFNRSCSDCDKSEQEHYQDKAVFDLKSEEELRLAILMDEHFGADTFTAFKRFVKGKFSLRSFEN